jgi:hypothetical protein
VLGQAPGHQVVEEHADSGHVLLEGGSLKAVGLAASRWSQMSKKHLKKAILIMGDVNETVGEWVRTSTVPVGFVAFDLDYYSSTKAALNIFEGSAATHLPRVHCYFDDVSSNDVACMNPYVGELLAIQEFNDSHDNRKISRIELMREQRPRYEPWQGKTYVMHDFQHPSYNEHVLAKLSKYVTQLPL